MPTLIEYTFLGYWWAMAMKIPGLIFYSWRAVVTIPLCILFFIALFNRQIAEHLSEKWKGISPWWSVAVISILLLWGIMWAIYGRDREVYLAYKAIEDRSIALQTENHEKDKHIEDLKNIITQYELSKTVKDQPTFVEKVEKVTFQFGNNIVTQDIERLREKKFEPFHLQGYSPISLYVEDNKLYADVKIYGGTGKPPIEVVHNIFVVRQPRWDYNSNKNSLEIINENHEPIFQMIYKTQSHIIVNGILPLPKGIMLLSQDKGMQIIQTVPTDFHLKRIFKYPSSQYPEQLDDGFKPRE